MSKTSVITTRVDPELKSNAEHILLELGMTTAQAITMFLKQVELNRGLPFAPRLPSRDEQHEERQAIIKQALAELMDAGTFNDIDDPVEWQRSLRVDRPIPSRDVD